MIPAFAALLALCLLIAPDAAGAQPKVYRIGVLDPSSMARNTANLDAFREGMRELGYVDGQHFVIEYRSGRGVDAFAALAGELARLKVDLILTRGTAAVTAAKNATQTIPVVMASSGDPLGSGVVAGLARPGGNITGLSSLSAEVTGKRLQLLKETVPGLRRLAAVFDKGTGFITQWRATQEAARAMGLEPHLFYIDRVEDLGPAFEAAHNTRAEAVMVGLGPVTQNNVERVVALAARYRLPSAFISREFTDAGGLMSFGVSYPDAYRRAATYVDKIFKGARPADLPIEQPSKFEFVLNMKAAKTLGLAIPSSVLLRADDVIR